MGPFGLVCGGFPAALGRRGFGVGRSVVPGFFRIAKSVFSKIASSFGAWKIVFGLKLRGLRKPIQAKQRFPSNLACIKVEGPTAMTPSRECRPADTASGRSRPQEGPEVQ